VNVDSPESALLASLQFPTVPETWDCHGMVAGTPDGPQPVIDFSPPTVLIPGETFSLKVTWSGGPITTAKIGIGNGATVTVPVSTNGLSAGTAFVPVRVDPNVCDDLHQICHQLICCMQVSTSSGKLSAAQATQMVLDCTNGVGCPAIGYPTPPSSCACNPMFQNCSDDPCGALNQACCSGDFCNSGLTCQSAICKPLPTANTGGSCTSAIDCGGTAPTCITKDSNGIVWPGGYCTSKCNPTKNDPNTGVNVSCPGSGTCIGYGVTGLCEATCTNMSGTMPCTRMGYSCFQSCEPSAESECNPTVHGSCPQDGGSVHYVVDLGMEVRAGRTCFRIGADDVGACGDSCNPFVQDCGLDQNGDPQGCYATADTGEGICVTHLPASQGDGALCNYLNDCDAGFGCHPGGVGMAGTCRAYCGGPNAVTCVGATCSDLSPTVSAATIGYCVP
jgi:hypothetical protein